MSALIWLFVIVVLIVWVMIGAFVKDKTKKTDKDIEYLKDFVREEFPEHEKYIKEKGIFPTVVGIMSILKWRNKRLEEMDLEKLKEEIIEKLPQLKNKTIYIHEWYELQMWEYDTKIKIKTEGTSKKEAIRAFRKKLGGL